MPRRENIPPPVYAHARLAIIVLAIPTLGADDAGEHIEQL